MKSRMRVILCGLIAMISISFTGAAAVSTSNGSNIIEERICVFEKACQNVDINGILSSVNPEIGTPARLALALVGALSDTDYDDCIDWVFDGLKENNLRIKIDGKEFLKTMSFSNIKIHENRNTAVADCKLNFELNEQLFKLNARINLIDVEDDWYINSIELKFS